MKINGNTLKYIEIHDLHRIIYCLGVQSCILNVCWLVCWVSGLLFECLDLCFECLDLYLGVWTCILNVCIMTS